MSSYALRHSNYSLKGTPKASLVRQNLGSLYLLRGNYRIGAKNFSDALTSAGIHNVYFDSPGTAHEWLTWSRCLHDFAPRLFR